MTRAGSVRVGLGAWLVGAGMALGQTVTGSSLPAAQPTAAAGAVQTTYAAPKQDAGKRARVTWVGGELTIAADNSSINQILREISRVTGMKVTGGVAEERVFGSYGPGTADEVLQMLLTGMGTNMLLKQSAMGAPVELLLTSRQGGATPPGPASFAGSGDDREDDLPPQQQGSRMPAGMSRPEFPNPPAAAGAGGGPGAAQSSAGGAGANPPAAATATTDQQSPNGVKTPQQIYDQLMQLQKQKAAQAPPQ